ncbi:MAG: SAM-dependent methyltransferase, partial [Candidatus Caldatribacteriaceae bacterium]
PLLSYRSQNRNAATRKILALLQEGKNLAFVSDAGMPGIQDPGLELVRILEEKGLDFEVLPGPSSLLLAVVYAAFPDPGFTFLGFLPRRGGERKELLKKSLSSSFSVVLYESPHRLKKTLQDIWKLAGDSRRVVLVRELTKLYQTVQRGTIAGILREMSSQEVKGEIALVIEGCKGDSFLLPGKLVEMLREKGLTKKDIVEVLSEGLSIPKGVIKRDLQKK